MKYHSPACVAEADNEVAAIGGGWGGERCGGAVPLPPCCGSAGLPPAGEVPSVLEPSRRCSTDGVAWAGETTQLGPRNYGLTL